MKQEHATAPAAPTAVDTEHPHGRPSGRETPVRLRTAQRSGWTGGTITAVVIGTLLALSALILLGGAATALWADRTQRDAGYLTSDIHQFSTPGAAVVTKPTDLGTTGNGWLFSPPVLDKIRIRVEPVSSGAEMFVGIGPSAEVDRYLAGVMSTMVFDFWTQKALLLDGGTAASRPGQQDFWVASSRGTGPRSLEWEPTNGSWTVVVMNADGQPGIDVRADLGATAPAFRWIALGVLTAGAVLAAGGGLLIAGAVRQVRPSHPKAVSAQ